MFLNTQSLKERECHRRHGTMHKRPASGGYEVTIQIGVRRDLLMSRPALLALGCLVALAPVRVFGEGTQSDKCQLRVAWKEKSERASLDVVDGQRPDLSRPF